MILSGECTKHVAFHEAGHAAVNAFLGVIGLSHFEGLTIIPNQVSLGSISHSRVTPVSSYIDGPKRLLEVKAKTTIMFHLAGRVAESRVNDDMLSLEDAVIMGGWENTCDTEEGWRQTVDEGRALEIAEIISNKIWNPWRVLFLMEKWTDELIEIPLVWGVIEALASKLLEDGKIIDFDVFSNMVSPIEFNGIEYPIWKEGCLLIIENLSPDGIDLKNGLLRSMRVAFLVVGKVITYLK